MIQTAFAGIYTYSAEPKVTQNTSASTSHYASILYLGKAGVTVHLRELELGLSANTLGKGGIADDVSKRLSKWRQMSAMLLE
jgi:hypothetical protein